MVVELSVVLSMEAEAVGVGDGGVVDSAGELRATKGAGVTRGGRARLRCLKQGGRSRARVEARG